jgi:outer membrane immunogenic protein
MLSPASTLPRSTSGATRLPSEATASRSPKSYTPLSGGVAFGKLEQQLTFSNLGSDSTLGGGNGGSTFVCPPGTGLRGSASGIAVGWTAGAGFEYAITPQVSLKAECLFVDLGSHSVTARSADPGTTPDVFLKASSDTELHIVRAGMNVKF